MLTVSQALNAILCNIKTLDVVMRPLHESVGYVLAEDVYSDIDNPPFDNSAVDGYAVMAEDTVGAAPERPVVLTCIGETPAGVWPNCEVTAGNCIKIFTGAPLPQGANSIVMVEDTRTSGEWVEVLAEARPGDHVRRSGEDIRSGDLVVNKGSIIQSAEIAMLAAVGTAVVPVVRKPRVAIISTGDEVVDVSAKPGPGQIRNSNMYALAALVDEAGAQLHSMRHVADTPAAVEDALRSCAGMDGTMGADVIVTSGGVSVGERDFVKPALEKLGKLDFWRVQMKPGKPLAVGQIGQTLFFGLPGNPVSTMVTFEVFVRPSLWKMAGRTDVSRPIVPVKLASPVRHMRGREEFVRAATTLRNCDLETRPTGLQGSGIMSSMLGANSLLVLPAESGDFNTGDIVSAILLSAPYSTTQSPSDPDKNS